MGYNTFFTGQVSVDPPLNAYEIEYLDRFSRVRHSHRATGLYVVDGADESDVVNDSEPQPGLPGYWCQWVPDPAGKTLAWDEEEKFYYAELWMAYVIDTFLKPGATVAAELAEPVPGRVYPEAFRHFTFDHVVNGVIDAEGDEEDDVWRIEVRDNAVHVVRLVTRPDYYTFDELPPQEWGTDVWDRFAAATRHNYAYVIRDGAAQEIGPAAESGFDPIEP
ncbi:hypothetical protein OHA21_29415 [Actinoplanes sp. NBC_00393]|uniref:hypothetical protein n=1 Tax=Actinoplanes sp. NBC_00393 TaxID=2975953 RepID=UPI002E249574